MIYFITGGERSGKSRYAQQLALELTDKPIYIATARKWDDINQEELNKWMTDFVNEKTPAGECFTDLHQRVKEFFDEIIILHNSEKETVVIITHAGVIRSILCQVLDIPLRNAFKIPIDLGGITKISIDAKSCCQSIGYINLA